MNLEFEKIIIKAIYLNPTVRDKILPVLDVKWFNNNLNLGKIVKSIIAFNNQYEAMPNTIEIRRLLNDDELIKEFDSCMSIPDEEIDTKFIIKEIEKFVQLKKLWQSASNIVDYCKSPNDVETSNNSFAEQVVEAETFNFDSSVGISFFEDTEKIYEDAISNEKIYGTGVQAIDDLLNGGLYEKSLYLLLAPTNIGKTLMMCSLSTNMVRANYNVLYVTFEDSETKIAKRIAQNMFDVTQEQLKLMTLDDYNKCWTKTKANIKSNLIIKEFPEDSTNALMLEACIKELADKKGFKPDVVFIDYIGCMIPNGRENNSANSNTLLLKVAMQTRALAMKYGFPIVSGAQVNRGGYDSADVGLNDAADSFGQHTKADAVLAITQTPEFKEQNLYHVKLSKTRFGNNRGDDKAIQVDIDKQRIYDLPDYTRKTTASVKDFKMNNVNKKINTLDDFL